VDQINVAQKQGTYNLPSGKQADDVGRPLGLAIEHAMYETTCGGAGEPNDAYRNQLRTITFNVKNNPSLRDRLLTGSLAPSTLATMNSQDMASEEQQQKDAEIKRAAEKQHIIMKDQGPRIRRTHKGEEFVDGDGQAGTSESIFSSTAVRRPTIDENNVPESPSGPADRVQPPSEHFPSDQQHVASNGDAHRSHSPGAPTQDGLFPEVPAHLHQPLPVGGRVQADEDIDKLLKDEDVDSPPYSPKDYQGGAGDIWFGKVVMSSVAEFTATGRHIAGADLSGRIPWSQLAPSTLVVDGRIGVELASDYLCGLRFSNSTDVTVVAIAAPHVPSERAGFDKLFNYFTERKRYGVVGKHQLAAVKDTYVIPIDAGASEKPEFIQLLENNSLEDPTPDRMLLIVFVVRTIDVPPSEQATPYHPGQDKSLLMAAASPLNSTPLAQGQAHYASPSPGTRQGSQSIPSTNLAGSPLVNDKAISPSSQLPPQQGANALPHPIQPQQQQGQIPQLPAALPGQPLLVGPAAAAYVLGPQSNAPAIQELLQKAPSADVAQLNIVRDIITRNPAAANDYPALMTAIQQFTSSSSGRQGQPGL
jgi:SPOC domain/Transcription factor S-II (TFIIS), central domain